MVMKLPLISHEFIILHLNVRFVLKLQYLVVKVRV